jgi:DNA-binding GntR family transcriptional regulator
MIGMLGHIIDTATFSKIARDAGTPRERAAQHAGHRSHARLVEYIAVGDGAAAERLWRKHIVETTAFLTEVPTASTVLELFS